eukprot:CAMPEP_0197028886 /NCGR_PEP_ID=MMETSP1384-20130603/8464_1 /TAXON_ID=29189 /ORGANISM="Ammonia sp." /LENGTH=590 /DNA_ID=CAMNT_0042457955 /DNA_START=50 /DNA_END=1822 /DNA_ORIENTATION=+
MLNANEEKNHNKYGSVSVSTQINEAPQLAHAVFTSGPNYHCSRSHGEILLADKDNNNYATKSHGDLSTPKRKLKSPQKSPFFRPYSPALTGRSAPSPAPYLRHGIKEESTEPDEPSQADDDDEDSDKINVWQAGFTIVNLFLGLCLLSYPYALSCGSLSSLIPFLFICFALSYTGKLIVRCFNALADDVEHSYPMVGFYSFQNLGYYFISFGIIAELFGALCTNTIFLWRNLSFLLLPLGLSLDVIILICIAISLPTCWMLNFNELSINSFLGCVCKIFTAIVVFVTFFYNLDTVQSNLATDEVKMYPSSIQQFCISIGIYIMSFSGHPCLPGIYRAMKHPEKFEKLLDICFAIMCVSYVLISVFGYLTFGTQTDIIITGNLLTQNEYLSKTLIILVVAGCFFQVSPLIAVMAEIPENHLLKFSHSKANYKLKTRAFRTLLFIAICAASYVCMDKLALLEAITGSLCTMIVSVICPALFYYKLVLNKNVKKKKKKKRQIILNHTSINADFQHLESPIFGAQQQQQQQRQMQCARSPMDQPIDVDAEEEEDEYERRYKQLGLRIILYLYIIIGVIFGLYMFVTDLINAINQ